MADPESGIYERVFAYFDALKGTADHTQNKAKFLALCASMEAGLAELAASCQDEANGETKLRIAKQTWFLYHPEEQNVFILLDTVSDFGCLTGVDVEFMVLSAKHSDKYKDALAAHVAYVAKMQAQKRVGWKQERENLGWNLLALDPSQRKAIWERAKTVPIANPMAVSRLREFIAGE
jgi:hypothetical protein